jgi:hypothetical protein
VPHVLNRFDRFTFLSLRLRRRDMTIDIFLSVLYVFDLTKTLGDLPVNKSDLVEALARKNDPSKTETADIVDLFFARISKALTNGERSETRRLCRIFVKVSLRDIPAEIPRHMSQCTSVPKDYRF